MRNKSLLLVTASVTLAAVGLWGASAVGQNAAGTFTQAQVDAGHQAYNDNCAQCHLPDLAGTNDAPALSGSAFMGAWKGRTTKQLFSKIATTMPAGAGGSLSQKQYTDIVAYVLSVNGAVAGATAFTPGTAVPIGPIATGKAAPKKAAPKPTTTAKPVAAAGATAQTA